MITVKFYLDKRAVKKNAPAILKIAIIYKLKATYLPTGIKVHERNWDKLNNKIIKLPNKDSMNNFISNRKIEIDNLVYSYISNHVVFNNVYEIKKRILSDFGVESKSDNSKLFVVRFKKFAEQKMNKKTRSLYDFTLKRMFDFDPNLAQKKFENITKSWLTDFDIYLSKTSKSQNGRNIHFRNIRALFNDAINDNVTSFYPFKYFKFKQIETPKRSLTIDELRNFMQTKEEELKIYVDIFMLQFFLIGINFYDLLHAKSIVNGRFEYQRAKTKRLYSIKIEPEADEILNKYKGETHILNFIDTYDYKIFLGRVNRNLKKFGILGLSTYWVRHTWATIAASIDIPKDTIAHALGHGAITVTDIYIDFDQNKVDEANRRVIDYVLNY